MRRISTAVLICALVGACSGTDSQAEAPEAGASGGAPIVAAGAQASGPCSLFTSDEIGRMLGTTVDEGKPAGPMNSACQWESPTDEDAYVMVQLIDDTQYWETRSGVRGYETHGNVAREAFTAPELGGWMAGALTDSRVVYASVNGGNSSRDLALQMLRTALQRLEK
jgi:hypothetical protein